MKHKYLWIFLTIILIICVFCYIFCFKDQELTLNNKNTVQNNFYNNEKIGISFYYPSSYSEPNTEYISNENDGAGALKGRGVLISFGDDLNSFYLLAASSDYNNFKQNYYRGEADKERLCPEMSVYNKETMSLCLERKLAEQETFEKYSVEVDEGALFVSLSIYLNLDGEDYSGLTISQTYPNLSLALSQMLEDEERLSSEAELIINDLSRGENLPTVVEEQILDFETMLKTLKLEINKSSFNYNIYKNDKYHISFNYPKDLLINTFDERSVNIGDDSGFWHIIFYADPAPESLESWMEENKSLWTQVEELNINGQRLIKLDNRGTGEGSGQEYLLITIKDDYIYRFMYRYLDEEAVSDFINSITL